MGSNAATPSWTATHRAVLAGPGGPAIRTDPGGLNRARSCLLIPRVSALFNLAAARARGHGLAVPGCGHPEPASGAQAAHETVTLGQVLHLLVDDPHQRANLLAEDGTYHAKPLGDEVGPDGQP